MARFLADAGLLARLRYSSSVSGGSVANGILACGYRDVADRGFTGQAFDAHVLDPLVRRISRSSLAKKLIRGLPRTLGHRTRTDLLAEALDEWWFDGRMLADLPADVRWIFNASNMTTGVGFGFERDVVGDYVFGRLSTAQLPVRLTTAVAASAAVPGAFAEVVIDAPFPCADGRAARLLDGGAYDNSGLQPLDDLTDACLVAVNAGGTFRVGKLGRVPVVRDLQRANAILYKQSTGLRREFMVDRYQAWEQATTRPPDDAELRSPRRPLRPGHLDREGARRVGRRPARSGREAARAARQRADLVRQVPGGALRASDPSRLVADGRDPQPLSPRSAAGRAPGLAPAVVAGGDQLPM